MNIQMIIEEADIRVPNAFSTEQKVDWLNEVNYEFFDVVKIPKAHTVALTGTPTITVPTDMREKNIRKLVVGSNYYRSMIYEEITAAYNYYTLDETTNTLTFKPTPASGQTAIVVYDKISVTPFTSGSLTASPEAPLEYHWLYILGLCVRIAKAMNDSGLANNYESDFKNNLSVAQQNFLR